MGAWGLDIAQSDNAYDFLDELESWFPQDEMYDIINSKPISPKELDRIKRVFTNNKPMLRKVALNTYEDDKSLYVILYVAFLKFLEIELDAEDHEIFKEAYLFQTINCVDERVDFVNVLKKAVEEDTRYVFNGKGLLDSM